MQSPPEFESPECRKNMSYGVKALFLGLQCGLLMIGALVIWGMSYSRSERSQNVAEKIAAEWGDKVYICGPIVKEHPDSAAQFRPETFICGANVETKSLHRNIYEAEVFNAHVSMSGTFDKDSIAAPDDTLYVKLGIETGQIVKLSPLKIGGKTVDWCKSANYLFAKINLSDMPRTFDYSTDMDIHGSQSIFINPIGYKSSITIDGEAPNPSFRGYRLPEERNIRGSRFSAQWESDDTPIGVPYQDEHDYVGVNFLVGVDRYQKVSRSLKYAFLIIVLTYLSVLFAEIIMQRNIPLLNYFLIGAALVLFYLLLLALTEILSFGMAYLIASAMTIALISGYMWKMLESRKIGVVIGAILTGLYGCCYVLLSLSAYALLLGSLVLFIALAALMYCSLRIKRS